MGEHMDEQSTEILALRQLVIDAALLLSDLAGCSGDDEIDAAVFEWQSRAAGVLRGDGVDAGEALERIAELCAEDVMTAPIEEVHDLLRAEGLDPDAVARELRARIDAVMVDAAKGGDHG